MKKMFILAMLANLSFVINVSAQAEGHVYADAEDFLKNLRSGTNGLAERTVLSDIVAFYANDPGIVPTNLKAKISTMPFLKDFAAELLPDSNYITRGADGQRFTGGISGAGSGLLGLNVATFADGIAKFLIERGKQELSMAFFKRFHDDLENIPELGVLFPNSRHLVDEIQQHNILNLLQELRDAFIKDLLNIPTGILDLRNVDKKSDSTGRKILEDRKVIIALLAIQGIINGETILEIINNISDDQQFCSATDNLSGTFKLAAILLDASTTVETDEGQFISGNQVKRLFLTKDLLQVFLGLTYQKTINTAVDCTKDVVLAGDSLEGIFKQILAKRNSFQPTFTSFEKVNTAFATVKNIIRKGAEPSPALYAALALNSFDMLVTLAEAIQDVTNTPDKMELEKVRLNLATGAQICNDIQARNYAGIFNGAIRLIQENNLIEGKTQEKLVKYLAFGANLASASTSDEVKDAIDAVALPPGSYAIKQALKI